MNALKFRMVPPPIRIAAACSVFADEEMERYRWQSQRTKDGQRAELPLGYVEAWDAAHAEEAVRGLRSV